MLFERAQSTQARWTESGDKGHVTALEAGFDRQLVDLLSNDPKLIQTFQKIDSKIKTDHNSSKYSLEDGFQRKLNQSLSNQAQEVWTQKALKLITFVFPRDQYFEPRCVELFLRLDMTFAKTSLLDFKPFEKHYYPSYITSCDTICRKLYRTLLKRKR